GLEQHITLRLPIEEVTPAVSQGAIGCCSRADDVEAARWMKPLDDQPARLATTAERALLRRIEGGCQVPLGALGRSTSARKARASSLSPLLQHSASVLPNSCSTRAPQRSSKVNAAPAAR